MATERGDILNTLTFSIPRGGKGTLTFFLKSITYWPTVNSGEAQLKKSPCISVDHSCSLVPTDIVCFILSIDSSRANQVSANLYQMLKLRKPPLALVGPKPNFFRISEMGAPFKLFIECLGIVGVQALVTCIMEFIID